MRRFTRFAPALLALAAAWSCDQPLPLDPDEVSGTYVLESVGGTPLPALVSDGEMFTVRMVADTFRLTRERTGARSYALRVRSNAVAGQPEEAASVQTGLAYQLRGERIEFEFICPPNALCAPPPHWVGRVTATGLRLDGQTGTYVYRRIAP